MQIVDSDESQRLFTPTIKLICFLHLGSRLISPFRLLWCELLSFEDIGCVDVCLLFNIMEGNDNSVSSTINQSANFTVSSSVLELLMCGAVNENKVLGINMTFSSKQVKIE